MIRYRILRFIFVILSVLYGYMAFELLVTLHWVAGSVAALSTYVLIMFAWAADIKSRGER